MKTVLVFACILAAVISANARETLLQTILQDLEGNVEQRTQKETATDEFYFGKTSQHSTDEILAQALCQFSASTEGTGRVFAVGRACNGRSKTCTKICQESRLRQQDSQTRNDLWSCVGAYHIYRNRPNTNLDGDVGSSKLGLKTAKTSCDRSSCGPNFCCCFASDNEYIE